MEGYFPDGDGNELKRSCTLNQSYHSLHPNVETVHLVRIRSVQASMKPSLLTDHHGGPGKKIMLLSRSPVDIAGDR
jgi:hypothetical protein